MGRSGIVLAILVLIGCYLFATSIPSKEDGNSAAATAANWFDQLLPTEFEPWPSSSPSHVDYDDDDDENNSAGPFIGIDFGATSSRVGFYNDGKVEIIPNDQGSFTTPSWVAFTDSSETPPLVGEAAKNQAAVNPERTIFEVSRLIGRKFEDKEVQSIMKLVPYKIVNKEGKPYIQVQFKDGDTKFFSPEEISAMILTRLKETAEAFIGKKITNAIVPVPSYFDDDQIQAIRDACSIAGLNVKLTHNQFAIAYANGLHEVASRKKVIVVDIANEAFAFTIFEIGHGTIYYLADTHLGGHEYNQRIMEYLIKLIKNKYGKDVSNDNKALVKLRMEADRVKRALSSQHQVRVELFEDLFETVTFEELNNDLFMRLVKKAFEEAPPRLEKHHIDDIIVVGGSTNVPKIQQLLRGYFNGKVEPMKGADEAVAIGAALAGYPPIRNPGSAIGL